MKKIKAGIIGGAGYTGGELIRLLINHPYADLIFVQSNSHAEKQLYEAHNDLFGEINLSFCKTAEQETDVLFLCGGHDAAKKFLLENNVSDKTVIIDLSQDFRHHENSQVGNRNFIYGLPELNKEKIAKANSIANPGCFATCIELALLPLAANQILQTDIHISAITGSTGAGQTFSETSHFSWRFGNASVYKSFEHQHLKEIGETIHSLQKNYNSSINFIPQRGSFARGIFASIYFKTSHASEEIINIFEQFYHNHPFVQVCPFELNVKQVLNTNRCFLHIEKYGENILITSAIDNLLKGASGQAVQNMNIAFDVAETAGLQLKPSAF
jgi:N-acetyl-gamma-glutamyl-phosphate reductase